MSEYVYNIDVRGAVATYTGHRGVVTDNTGFMLHFHFDDTWDVQAVKYLICNTARGALPRVAFTGADVAMPRLYRSDGVLVRVGIVQGDQHTTTAAIVPVIPSCLIDAEAPPLPPGTAIDNEIDPTSANPVTNAAIAAALQELEELIGGCDNIFIAEYNVTTTAEIGAAISAGKTVFVHATASGENVLAFMTHDTLTYKFYAQLSHLREVTITLTSGGVWSLEVAASDRVFTVIYGRTTWAALLEYWHNGGGTRISLLDARRDPSHQYYGWLSEIYPNEGYARFDAFDTENNAIHHYTLESDNTWSVETVAYTADISLAEIANIIDSN